MNFSISQNNLKGAASAWGLMTLLALCYLIFRVLSGPVINSNLLALLPTGEQSEIINQAEGQISNFVERRFIVLISSKNKQGALKAAKNYIGPLEQSPLIAGTISGFEQNDLGNFLQIYKDRPASVLSEADRRQLSAGDISGLLKKKLSLLYGPVNAQIMLPLEDDPLMLFQDGVMSHMPDKPLDFLVEDNISYIEKDGVYTAFFSALLNQSPYQADYQTEITELLKEISSTISKTDPDIEMLKSGVIFHAENGTRNAKTEISLMGSVSILGVLCLFIMAFKSIRPFIATIIIISAGIMTSLSVSLLFFEQVYLITLVFGTSLVGISVDYSMHYFSEKYRNDTASSISSLRHILPGLTLGCLTSIIGFSGLLLAPFPGLVQMAIFCCVGLLVSFAGVVSLFPYIAKLETIQRNPSFPLIMEKILTSSQSIINAKPKITFSLLILIIVGGLSQIEFKDDLRSMQNLSDELLLNDRKVVEILGINPSTQFFIVQGNSENDLLEKEQNLFEKLTMLVGQGKLLGYTGVSQFVPSQDKQLENRKLIISVLSEHPDEVATYLSTLGILPAQIDTYMASLEGDNFLSTTEWKNSLLGQNFAQLLLDGNASIVSLNGVRDLDALNTLADGQDNLTFVDKVDMISNVFSDYRNKVLLLTVMAYGVIILFLVIRYWQRNALSVIMPPLMAIFSTIAILGFLGVSISLFHLIATLLILGVCVDYTIFLKENTGDKMPTIIAITLSAITTILSFGMLSFSSTTVIHDFGITIFIGILLSYLFSVYNVKINGLEELK
jgi:predicted exporter